MTRPLFGRRPTLKSVEGTGSIKRYEGHCTTRARAGRVRIDSLTPGGDRRSRAAAAATRVTRHATLHCSDAIDAKRHARYAIDARRATPKNNLPQKPYDDPKFASHVLYLSAKSSAGAKKMDAAAAYLAAKKAKAGG